GSAVTWSPDEQWIAFTMQDKRSFRNVHVVAAAGGESQQVTFLANGETASKIAWSPDGHYLLFYTAQRSEQVQIARVDLLPLGLNAEAPVISADGKELLFAARSANQLGLYTYSLDELSKEPPVARQLTSTPGRKTDYAFSPDAKDVFYLENGAVKSIAVESRTPKTIAVTAPMQIDFDVEKKVVFEEAWETLNRRFFDAKFNGKNWLKLHDEWTPYIA